MQNDTNTLGYNQWFYFSVHHNQANVKYTFKIVNFVTKIFIQEKKAFIFQVWLQACRIFNA